MYKNKKVYIVGDIRYTEKAESIYENIGSDSKVELLLKLQEVMEEFGVVKIDISIDLFKFFNSSDEI